MTGSRWIKVDATIVECFRAWEERPGNTHPWFEVLADIETPDGQVQRVSGRQKLHTRTRDWRAPDPGEIVPARWDPTRGALRLELGGDLRYDERLMRAVTRNREVPSWSPTGGSGME